MPGSPEVLTNTAAAARLLALLHQSAQQPPGTQPTASAKGNPMAPATRDREYPSITTTASAPARPPRDTRAGPE